MRIRVYADADYRTTVLRWRAKVSHQIDRVNRVLGPTFGVELAIEGVHDWQRRAPANRMDAMLEELEQLDPGADVDWVVGLVAQLSEVTSSLHHLGMARGFGAHFVIRGMNDTAERAIIDQVLDQLSESERERLYQDRKAHKELTLFLHEWGHTLGALHDDEPISVMHPSYSNKSAGFTAANRGLMAIVLRSWGKHSTSDRAALRDELRAYLAEIPSTEWRASERARLETSLEGPRNAVSSAQITAELTPAGRRAFRQAMEFEQSGQYQQAWRAIEPLTEQYDGEAQVQLFGCHLAALSRGAGYPTEKLCQRATLLAPDDARPHLSLARAYLAGEQQARAVEHLRIAHARLDGAGDTEDQRALWRSLAISYQRLDLVTWAEQALARAGDDVSAVELRRWAAQTRRRYGLPPQGAQTGVAPPPQDEGAYLASIKALLSDVYAGKHQSAQRQLSALRRAYPRAPGPLVAGCDLYLRAGRPREARRHCDGAIAIWDELQWAHYLAGVLAAQQRRHRAAVVHLERAIELDPSVPGTWKQLAREYEALGQRDQRAELERQYEQRFSQPLP
jgi:predicted Zn-dependent protease